MTKQVLFIQGGGAGTHDNWDSKLVASLTRELGQGYDIRYPRMPNEGDPSYPAWKTVLEKRSPRSTMPRSWSATRWAPRS